MAVTTLFSLALLPTLRPEGLRARLTPQAQARLAALHPITIDREHLDHTWRIVDLDLHSGHVALVLGSAAVFGAVHVVTAAPDEVLLDSRDPDTLARVQRHQAALAARWTPPTPTGLEH